MEERYGSELEDPVVALWGNLNVSLRSLDKYAQQSSVKSFVELAARLDNTINHIRFMVIIPETLLIHQQMNLHFLSRHLWAALKTETVKPYETLTMKEREAYEAALNESVTKGKERVELRKTLREWISKAAEQKSKVIELYNMVEPYNSLLYSGLVWTWTAFEVFAADLWEACINLSTGKVRSRMIKSFGTVKPVIKIDDIVKYNYDIRGQSRNDDEG